MNKIKIFKISTIVLLILNIGFMVFPLIIGPPHKNSIENIIIKELKLDKEQVKDYKNLITNHVDEITELEHDILLNKELLYIELVEPNPEYKDSILSVIGTKYIEIEKTHFNHFVAIKKLCKTKEQTEAFNSLAKELKDVFSNKHKRMRD